MSVKERILNTFNHCKIDRISFLTYPFLIPHGEIERLLRNNGFGYWWITSPLIIKNEKIERVTTNFYKNGKEFIKVSLKCKHGEIFEIWETGGGYGTSLRKKFFIEREEDYYIFEEIAKTEKIDVDKELYKNIEKNLGNDGILVSWLPKTPFQSILYELIGPENYAFHLFDYQNLFLNLYEFLFKRYLKKCEILSETEFEFFEIADNITSEMIGLERFKKFILPVYEKVCEIFHYKNKKIGSHMDGNLKILVEEIHKTKLDFIDAFTPYPDTDLTLKEAKEKWKEKIIIINYPSSVHIRKEEEIKKITQILIEEAYPGDNFIINLTENIPSEHWQKSLKIINETLIEYGEVPKGG
ncbi:MAG TPA: uroporphyrinogen decarboxylase family protein [bacterium]|nr:uroporphyrinogen decarboxylase family protein [bacterium]HOM26620.1 uroporphyrinogen decarboxylase family protein [bacterium]